MTRPFRLALTTLGLLCFGFACGWLFKTPISNFLSNNPELITPLSDKFEAKELPLAKYYLRNLAKQTFTATGPIIIVEKLSQQPSYTSYLFTYTTQGKTISGQLNVPSTPAPATGYPAIVMLRGYVPLEIYQTGVGTRNAAAVLAEEGFVTVAPDFLGYGKSDPELKDTWEARFVKPVQVAELLATLRGFPQPSLPDATNLKLNPAQLGLWAHSNGGQIALATLEITGEPLPTTLWAPVTAPFPYSITFFSDELADEGKEQRAWVAMFEEDYDAFEFSLTKHLDLLPNAPLLIHHGVTDDAALIAWSDEFIQKIELENDRRATFSAGMKPTDTATLSARLQHIEAALYRYPNTDHNLQPNWNTVVERDVAFFKKELL
jgi:pimeloyl-ACP methyl ester carboxylesterase